MTPLPTIEQAREARRLINRGRKAMGLPRLRYLDFYGAKPDSTTNCLSARSIFSPAGYKVYDCSVSPDGLKQQFPEALRAMNMDRSIIPDPILAVTNAFDEEVEGLWDRLVEAGVVKP